MPAKTGNEFLPSLLVKMTEQKSDLAPVAASILKEFQKIADLKFPSNIFCRGVLYHKLALLEEIMRDYLKNQKISEKELSYYPVFAAIADGKTLREQAEASYRETLESDPYFNEAHFNLGILLKDRGEDAAALGHFQQSAQGKPHSHSFPHAYLSANSLFEIAEIFEDKNENFLAESNYRNALQGQSNFGPYHTRVAKFLREQGKLDDALEHFDRLMPYSHRYVTAFVVPDFAKAEQEKKNPPAPVEQTTPQGFQHSFVSSHQLESPKPKKKHSFLVGTYKFLRRKTLETLKTISER